MIKKLTHKIKEHFMAVLNAQTSPHSIALGFAVGTFLAIIPAPGFNILLGVLAVFLCPKLNKIALLGAFLIWNPFLSALVYALSYKAGQAILGSEPVASYELTVWNKVFQFTSRILVGSLVVGLVTATISYGIIRLGAQKCQERKK